MFFFNVVMKQHCVISEIMCSPNSLSYDVYANDSKHGVCFPTLLDSEDILTSSYIKLSQYNQSFQKPIHLLLVISTPSDAEGNSTPCDMSDNSP